MKNPTNKRKILIPFKDFVKVKNLTYLDTLNDFHFYLEDKLSFYVDIRTNNPNVGVIVDGVFFKCFTYEDYLRRNQVATTGKAKGKTLLDIINREIMNKNIELAKQKVPEIKTYPIKE